MKLHTLTGALALAGLLSACSMAPLYEKPAAPVPTTWQGAAAAPVAGTTAGTTAAAPLQWEQFFGNAQLREVIALTLANNRDLRAAALNVEAFQALYRIQKADGELTGGVQLAGNRQRVPADVAGAPTAVTASTFTAAGIVMYELDLFGRLKSLSDEALHKFLAMDSTRKAAELSLVAATASAWMAWQADQQMLDVVTRTLAANEKALELITVQLDNGIATDLQRLQAQTAVDSAHAQHAQLTRAVAQGENALQALVGAQLPAHLLAARVPAQDWQLAQLPVGLPSQVMLQRPDIAAAEAQLQAANANIGAARAAFYPSISLTGSVGTASRELSGLLGTGSSAWSFAPQINIPVFYGGRLSAQLDYATLQKDVRVAQYEQAIQTAFREVADGLAARQTFVRQLQANESLVKTSGQYLALAQLRYDAGVEGYLTVLDAQRNLLGAQLGTVQTALQQAISQVQLFKALGGGWQAPAPVAAQ